MGMGKRSITNILQSELFDEQVCYNDDQSEQYNEYED